MSCERGARWMDPADVEPERSLISRPGLAIRCGAGPTQLWIWIVGGLFAALKGANAPAGPVGAT